MISKPLTTPQKCRIVQIECIFRGIGLKMMSLVTTVLIWHRPIGRIGSKCGLAVFSFSPTMFSNQHFLWCNGVDCSPFPKQALVFTCLQ